MTERTFQSGHHRKRHHRGYRSYLLTTIGIGKGPGYHTARSARTVTRLPSGPYAREYQGRLKPVPSVPTFLAGTCSRAIRSGSISQGNVPEPCPATIPHRTKRTMILTQTRRTGCIRQGVHLMRSLNVGDSMRSFLYFRLTAENPLLPMKLQSGPDYDLSRAGFFNFITVNNVYLKKSLRASTLRRPDLHQLQGPPLLADVRGIAHHLGNHVLLALDHALGAAEGEAPAVALVAGELGLDL